MRITFIGHVCVDQNLIRGEVETFYGGGVIHGAVTAQRLGAEVSVLTKCAAADLEQLCESPFTGFTVEGRTGRGDTCTAAFLVGLQRMGLREATALAAEVTSRKMQYRGAYRG